MKNLVFILIGLLSIQALAQKPTDLQQYQLKGPVKTVKIERFLYATSKKKDTIYSIRFKITQYYSKKGKLDSIINTSISKLNTGKSSKKSTYKIFFGKLIGNTQTDTLVEENVKKFTVNTWNDDKTYTSKYTVNNNNHTSITRFNKDNQIESIEEFAKENNSESIEKLFHDKSIYRYDREGNRVERKLLDFVYNEKPTFFLIKNSDFDRFGNAQKIITTSILDETKTINAHERSFEYYE